MHVLVATWKFGPPPMCHATVPQDLLARQMVSELCGVLPADQVEAMYLLGPDYQSTFAPTESNTLLQQTPKAAALIIEGKEALGPKLLISYNAQVCVPLVSARLAGLGRRHQAAVSQLPDLSCVQAASVMPYKHWGMACTKRLPCGVAATVFFACSPCLCPTSSLLCTLPSELFVSACAAQ